MKCRVVSSKRFKEMTKERKASALAAIEVWEKSLQAFKTRLQ